MIVGYLYVDEMQKAKSNGQWPDFEKRMAAYLVKKPTVSQMLGFKVDELESAYGVCPCGQGIVIAYAYEKHSFYEKTRYIPAIICHNCKQMFSASVQLLQPKMAIDPAVAIQLWDQRGNSVSLPLHTRGEWKMLSW